MLADRCCSRRTYETWEKLSFRSAWRWLTSPSDLSWLHPAASVRRAPEAMTANIHFLFSPPKTPKPPHPRTLQLLAEWRQLAAVCLLSHGSSWPLRLAPIPPIRRTYAPTVPSNPISWFEAWSPPGAPPTPSLQQWSGLLLLSQLVFSCTSEFFFFTSVSTRFLSASPFFFPPSGGRLTRSCEKQRADQPMDRSVEGWSREQQLRVETVWTSAKVFLKVHWVQSRIWQQAGV